MADITVIPMAGIMLCLLIVFMLITPLMSPRISVMLAEVDQMLARTVGR